MPNALPDSLGSKAGGGDGIKPKATVWQVKVWVDLRLLMLLLLFSSVVQWWMCPRGGDSTMVPATKSWKSLGNTSSVSYIVLSFQKSSLTCLDTWHGYKEMTHHKINFQTYYTIESHRITLNHIKSHLCSVSGRAVNNICYKVSSGLELHPLSLVHLDY